MCKLTACRPSCLVRKFIVTRLAIINEFIKHIVILLAREGGLEPTTLGLGDRCSTNGAIPGDSSRNKTGNLYYRAN